MSDFVDFVFYTHSVALINQRVGRMLQKWVQEYGRSTRIGPRSMNDMCITASKYERQSNVKVKLRDYRLSIWRIPRQTGKHKAQLHVQPQLQAHCARQHQVGTAEKRDVKSRWIGIPIEEITKKKKKTDSIPLKGSIFRLSA